MLSVIRKHDARDREACDSAYRRGQEAFRRSDGATINPFLPGTSFHKAFDLGVLEARSRARSEEEARAKREAAERTLIFQGRHTVGGEPRRQ